jgi:hypothetical protein
MVDRRCPGCSQPPSACWVVNEPADTPAGDVAQDRDWYRLLRGDLGDRQERIPMISHGSIRADPVNPLKVAVDANRKQAMPWNQ